MLHEQQQQIDLPDAMSKILNEIQTDEMNMEINVNYIMLDRDNLFESYNSCKCLIFFYFFYVYSSFSFYSFCSFSRSLSFLACFVLVHYSRTLSIYLLLQLFFFLQFYSVLFSFIITNKLNVFSSFAV